MARLAMVLFCFLVLGACGATGPSRHISGSDSTQAERLAAALSSAAQTGDPVLDHVIGEMTALEAALARGVPASPEDEQAASGEPELALVPRPGSQGVLSLMHAIHLASYREERHLAEGWRALQGQHPSLAGLRARAVPADLGERGVYLRLLAGPFDTADDARRACRAIEAGSNWCAITAFDGTPVSSDAPLPVDGAR